MDEQRTFTSFAGARLIASGSVEETLRRTKEVLDGGEDEPVLVFEDQTGAQVDFDLRGTFEDVLARLPTHPLFAAELPAPRTGPGRPKLGVVCREVSLLPRHWEWLAEQPGGASVTLRKLVDEARRKGSGAQRARQAREAAGRFMSVMGGDLPGFEEASRALWAKDSKRLDQQIHGWPEDVRKHLRRLVREAERLEREAADGAPATTP